MKNSFKYFAIAVILIFAAYAAGNTDGALVLERANSNDNVYSNATGEFVSHLRGNVVFRYEDMRIVSDEAVWQKNRGIVDFRKNVKVTEKGQLMTCDRMHFVREKNLLTAVGKVAYADSARITNLRGDNAEYRTDTKVARLWGSPVLARIDSVKADGKPGDTLVIRGRIMVYNDSTKVATVIDAVTITRGSLRATCRHADYHMDAEVAKMRQRPVINYEKHRIVGDSVDLFFGGEAFKGAAVMGSAHGYVREVAADTRDTTITNIWGDSMYISMYESGKMESIAMFGSARGTHADAPASLPGGAAPASATVMKFSSDSLRMSMYELSGKTRMIKAFGSAKCDYEEKPPAGGKMSAVITGDSLHAAMYESGKPRVMRAFGGSRAVYSETFPSGSVTAMDVTSDSMRVSMSEIGKMRAMRAFGNAHGRSAEMSASASDSMITHIWSDSLRVVMAESGKVRTMKAFGSVRSLNFMLADSSRANDISGQTMTLAFDEAGRIDQALVSGGAKSVYYLDETEGSGHNRAEGDRIHVAFALGKAHRLRVRGSVTGHYAP